MNYKGHFAFFALFLLLSVVAVTAQQALPNLACGTTCTVTVRFAPSSDGERVEMDGVNIGEKESTYVSSNLMIYKALGFPANNRQTNTPFSPRTFPTDKYEIS